MADVNNSVIVQNARDEIPIAWSALNDAINAAASPGQTSTIQPGFFQRKLDVLHDELFGVILTDAEEALLDRKVLEYAGKVLALKVIPGALDFWAAQVTTQSASGGRNESRTFTDRAAQLRELRKILLEETRAMWNEVSVLLPSSIAARSVGVPHVAQVGESTTPDPYDFEPPYDAFGQLVPGTRGTM